MLSLGAIHKHTRLYVTPTMANKKDTYICTDCKKDLILCQGEIRTPYFRHKIDLVSPCNHYSHPTESQIHKDAKLRLQTYLQNKSISFIRNCCACKKKEKYDIPEMSEGSVIQLEHRFEYHGPKIADIAYIDEGEIVSIIEICHTHKTSSDKRPEPWFEVDAMSLLQLPNESSQLQIPCIRCEKCDECIEKETKIKKNIRKRINDISSCYQSDSIICYSGDILEILQQIICGEDSYTTWASAYRIRIREQDTYFYHCDKKISQEEFIQDKYIGYSYNNKSVEYFPASICLLESMKLYLYLSGLEVYHGSITFIFKKLTGAMSGQKEWYLTGICRLLFGSDTSVTVKLNDCIHCNGEGFFGGERCYYC